MTRPLLLALLLVACGEDAVNPITGCTELDYRCNERYKYNSDECKDSATLVATTAGSPNSTTCENKHHRMRVEVATVSGEEIGATVFCECERSKK